MAAARLRPPKSLHHRDPEAPAPTGHPRSHPRPLDLSHPPLRESRRGLVNLPRALQAQIRAELSAERRAESRERRLKRRRLAAAELRKRLA